MSAVMRNGDDFGNLFPPHIVQFSTCRAVLDDVLGDWADFEGYLRKDEHRLRSIRIRRHGCIRSFIHIVGDWDGSAVRGN